MIGTFYPDEPETTSPCLSLEGGVLWQGAVARAHQALTDCVRHLDTLASSTEDEFLLIGTRLREFKVRALAAGGSSHDIAANVDNTVVFLQFHDITRQHFEKSLKTCRGMSDMLSPLVETRNGGAVSREPASPVTCGDIARFCLAEVRAIKKTRGEFMTSVETVLQNLDAIATDVCTTGDNTLADEIKRVIHEIRVHKTVDALSQEVLSSLNGMVEDVRQFIPAEVWKEIVSESAPVSASNGSDRPSGKEKDVSQETGNTLGDNVELF